MKKWVNPQILNLSIEDTKEKKKPQNNNKPQNNGAGMQPNDVWCSVHNKYHGKDHGKDNGLGGGLGGVS